MLYTQPYLLLHELVLKCYSCEGTGSDAACMKKNPSKTDVTCGPNQYCSVVRTTLTPVVDNSASVASVAAPVAATDAKQSMARYHHALKPIFYFDF
jgi:hypothetical protein